MRRSLLQGRTKQIVATSLFATAWMVAVASGLHAMFHYENEPGPVGPIAQIWPAAHLERATDRPTLVMAAHPHCPCTKASVSELAQIMARLQGRVAAYVLFIKPEQAGADWEDSGLRRSVEAIPGVTALTDTDGAEAKRFGAETSGHTVLFAADGRLLFSGGITGSRGHEGDNAGESAIVSLVNNQTPVRTQTLVFGCSLAKSAPGAGAAVQISR